MSEKNEEKNTPAAAPGAAKRRIGGLGRGLNALIEGSYEKKSERLGLVPHPVNSVGLIPVGQIEANPYQPRTHFDQQALQELAESIKLQGIIQPVTVRQTGTNAYQLISGERRLQASKLAGLDAIPAYIRKADDQQMLEMALIENIQRENLNAIEIALSYQLPPDIQIGLRDNVISMGHARALINIEDTEQQLGLFHRIVAEDLSVRRVEQLVRSGPAEATERKPSEPAAPLVPTAELRRTERHLSERFGSRVLVKPGPQGRGEIKIAFDSVEDMQRILHILHPA